jgi:hypothetical protein
MDSYYFEGDFFIHNDGDLQITTIYESDMASDIQELNWRRAMYPGNPENNRAMENHD